MHTYDELSALYSLPDQRQHRLREVHRVEEVGHQRWPCLIPVFPRPREHDAGEMAYRELGPEDRIERPMCGTRT